MHSHCGTILSLSWNGRMQKFLQISLNVFPTVLKLTKKGIFSIFRKIKILSETQLNAL